MEMLVVDIAATTFNVDVLQDLSRHFSLNDYRHKKSGNTMLHLACEEESIETIKFLLKNGADPVKKNKLDHTCF